MAKKKRDISNPAIPYRNYVSIVSDEADYEVGAQKLQATGSFYLVPGSQNVMTSASQQMERIPGFSDSVESAVTTFTAAARGYWWVKWGGTVFIHIVCDVSGGVAKVYKCQVGTDASYILIFTSSVAAPFDFVVSNNTLYMGNGTEMRKYSGTGSTTTKWGIARPAALANPGTTGTGITAYAGWYYRATYCNSATGHESSASDLTPAPGTGIITNKTITLVTVASADAQVDQIRIYRTTDGGSTDPTEMQEITGSPFANANATVNDSTPDTSLSTRTAPGTTSNDPPPACSKLIAYSGRIFGAANSTSYYSGSEELPANGVPEECWPSGLDGNNQPWAQEVTSQRPLADGVAVYTRSKIWKIAGNRRDNFVFGGLLDRRGAISHTATCALGNSVGWLDTSSQVFLDGQEIGLDIRNDIKNIDHSQAYMEIHIQGRTHWVCLLDGANGKLYLYDMDLGQWLPPKVLPAAASALSSGESASGVISLTVALSKTRFYKMNPAKYNDAGTLYKGIASTNLLRLGEPDGQFEGIAVETDSHIPSKVEYLADDDPTTATPPYVEITPNASGPVRRANGVNLVKGFYKAQSAPYAERVSVKVTWPAVDANFICNTITINPVITGATADANR